MNSKYFIPLLVYIVIVTMGMMFEMPEMISELESNINYRLSILSVINIIIFLVMTHQINRSWIRFEILFLLGFIIVHFQIPFYASIGIEPLDPYFVWINKGVVNYATWMSSTAIHLWMLGYILIVLIRRKTIRSLPIGIKRYMRLMDVFILILFFIFLILVGSEFLGGSYRGTANWGAGATYVFLLLNSVLFLRVIYFFRNAALSSTRRSLLYILTSARNHPILTGVICSYLPLFLLLGDRGPVAQLGLMIIGAYSIYFKRIGFLFFSSMIIIGSIVFTIVGFGRMNVQSDESILSSGYDSFNDRKEVHPTYELATTVRLQYRSLSVVPRYHPHLYGGTVALNFVSIIPFLGGRLISFFNIPEMYHSSSMFFTIISQGPNYTWGEGTEILADLYLNFGVFGAFIIMFLFGVFISVINLNCKLTMSDASVIMYLVFLIFAIYLNRSTLFFPLKLMTYMLVINKLIPSRIMDRA